MKLSLTIDGAMVISKQFFSAKEKVISHIYSSSQLGSAVAKTARGGSVFEVASHICLCSNLDQTKGRAREKSERFI